VHSFRILHSQSVLTGCCSIGLGGGSIVRKDTPSSQLTIGPDSVGSKIQEKALVFGGQVPTTTDYAVFCNNLSIGPHAKEVKLDPSAVREYKIVLKKMLEGIVDRMKTSAEDIPVLLVGGGVIIAPDTLVGASKVEKPEFAGVANAIGAAIAKVSGTVDVVVNTAGKTSKEVLEEACEVAVERAVKNGARRETVEIAEMEAIPLQVSKLPIYWYKSTILMCWNSILQKSLDSLLKLLANSTSLPLPPQAMLRPLPSRKKATKRQPRNSHLKLPLQRRKSTSWPIVLK
jgi:N-methylhydantoinase A/oxoprolinase/acetone carboxylase beta subunit